MSLHHKKCNCLAWQKPPVRAKLQPQFLTQGFALLQAREELIEKADDDCVYADAFGFGPVFELGACLRADVEELGVGEIHAGLAGLLNIYLILIHVA